MSNVFIKKTNNTTIFETFSKNISNRKNKNKKNRK